MKLVTKYQISAINTACTVRFSKKSLGSDVGEIKKMSEKFKQKGRFFAPIQLKWLEKLMGVKDKYI
jgi:hypothetical protein